MRGNVNSGHMNMFFPQEKNSGNCLWNMKITKHTRIIILTHSDPFEQNHKIKIRPKFHVFFYLNQCSWSYPILYCTGTLKFSFSEWCKLKLSSIRTLSFHCLHAHGAVHRSMVPWGEWAHLSSIGRLQMMLQLDADKYQLVLKNSQFRFKIIATA